MHFTFLTCVLVLQTVISSPIEENGSINRGDIVDAEIANQIEKTKEKLLIGLGIDSIPEDALPRDQIPSALLADIFMEPESEAEMFGNDTDSNVNFEKDEIIEKKTMILGKAYSLKKCGLHQCLKVSFFHELDPTDLGVLSAELWVYRESTNKDESSRLSIHTSKKKATHHKKSAVHLSHSTGPRKGDGWFATEIKTSQVIQHPQDSANLEVKFQLDIKCKCENCHFSMEKAHTPFISLKIVNRKKRITRRSLSDDKCNSSGCCRKPLTVNFKDIGWDKWVYYPQQYNAYYCKGNCTGASHQHKHTGVVKAVSEQKNRQDIPFCCTPKKFSSLSMIYMHKGSIIRRAISNMIVEDCWCV